MTAIHSLLLMFLTFGGHILQVKAEELKQPGMTNVQNNLIDDLNSEVAQKGLSVQQLTTLQAEAVPEYLYSWKTKRGLSRITKSLIKNKGVLKLEPLPPSDDPTDHPVPAVNLKFPFLDTARMIFSWTHPIGGMGRSRDEVYAGTYYRPKDARLLVLKINPNARIVRITSEDATMDYLNPQSDRVMNPPPNIDPANVDIYVFEFWNPYQDKNKPVFTEYIVNNMSVVEEYIYDLPRVSEILKKEIVKFKVGNPSFDEKDIYGGRTNDLYYSDKGLERIQVTLNSIIGSVLMCRSLFE